MSEVTAASIVMLLIIVGFGWLISVFVGWLREVWRTRHLSGWEWLNVFLSAGGLVIGFVIYRPAEWWETLGASIILLGALWTPSLVVRRLIRVWRARRLKRKRP